MKKLYKALLALFLIVPLVGCGAKKDDGKASTDKKGKVYKVAYLINGNLGDKSFFDSAMAGLTKLQKDGRITLKTIEMGGTEQDKPKWLSTLYEVSESKEYDVIVVGTYQMPDYLKEVATKYPNQKYAIFDDNTHVGANKNVLNLTYKQNELGYVVGTFAACMTKDTKVKNINPEKVLGFVGGVDSPVINDFLYGYIEGARAVDPEMKVDTRYTNDYVDTAKAKEYALSMIADKKADIIWGVAGNAGNGAVEAALEKKAWFIGVDSDQELSLSANAAAATLTSGLKNIGNSLIWVFDELDAGKEHWGTEVSLGLKENGVGIVTDKNFKKYASEETQKKVNEALKAVLDGKVKVPSALGDKEKKLEKLREQVRP
ncbi:BMP family ABC transporter substrate-binding protein [Bulleidia sp. zg-1006]|uniref:BMP family ABC transporter substrate-binding protein n=1 Tax=Bulleidia sp. zg-1006 TaxID=2806552 RepID=UPI00193A8603|nr:BMP family ABC transporter substrate-binding protein [Bulleidia sp. zg-1006]QRG86248.1 BMP family ABC transporter substrate-binding protein [Bulleidia sp. zg-1006]